MSRVGCHNPYVKKKRLGTEAVNLAPPSIMLIEQPHESGDPLRLCINLDSHCHHTFSLKPVSALTSQRYHCDPIMSMSL